MAQAGDEVAKAELAKKMAEEPYTPPRAALTDGSGGSGSGGGELRVVEHVVRQSTSMVQVPMLTRTNYSDWALVVQVQLEAQG